jgi:uncharacterized protein YbcI
LTKRRRERRQVKSMSLKQQLRRALEEFLGERLGRSRDMEVKIVDELILLRWRGAVLPAEIDLGTIRAGRMFLQEVSERLCQDLQPDLNRLLRKITGRRLLDICVGIFFRRREKILVFTMSDRIKQ